MSNNHQRGFMMPSVIIMSTTLLIIAVALTQLVVNNNQAITRAMFAQIAQTAAKSGVDYAKEQFVTSGTYDGTGETTIIQNGKYRVTFEVNVLTTSADGLKKEVESVGRVYLPELATSQLLLRSVRSDIIRTSATAITPNELAPMAWYDGADNSTMHGAGGTSGNWTHLNANDEAYLNERTSNGTQTNGSWNSSWAALGYSSQLGSVYTGVLFDLSGLPAGATIENARIRFEQQGTSIGLSWLDIQALAPSALPGTNEFSGPPASNQLRNKPTVGPTVTWTVFDWPSIGEDHFTPDIKSLVQAVLDEPGYNPATQHIGFRIDRSFGLGTHRIKKGAASLIINYTTAGGSTVNDGEQVVTWDDKSGNSRHLNAPVGREPTYLVNQQNGLSMLNFPYAGAGTGKYMGSNPFNLTETAQAGTMFIVGKPDTTSGSGAPLANLQGTIPPEPNCAGGQPCTTRIYELARDGLADNLNFYIDRSGTGGTSSLPVTAENVFASGQAASVAGGVAFAVGSCNPSMAEASADIANGRITTVNCPGSGSEHPKSFKDGLTITVANGRGGANYAGQIGEVIVYDKQLSCQQIQSIQKYLRIKWFADTSDTNIIACPAPPIPGF